MDRWKSRGGKSQRREEKMRREEKRRAEKRKTQKKDDAGARQGRKVAIHSVFPMMCGSGGSKSRLAKAAGAEPSGQMRDEKLHAVGTAQRCTKHITKSKCTKYVSFGALLGIEMWKKFTLLWRESHFEVKSVKNWWSRTTFGSWDVVQSTADSEHFLKLRCRKRERSTFPSQKC